MAKHHDARTLIWNGRAHNVGPPLDSVQLAQITTISIGFMVAIRCYKHSGWFITTISLGLMDTYGIYIYIHI